MTSTPGALCISLCHQLRDFAQRLCGLLRTDTSKHHAILVNGKCQTPSSSVHESPEITVSVIYSTTAHSPGRFVSSRKAPLFSCSRVEASNGLSLCTTTTLATVVHTTWIKFVVTLGAPVIHSSCMVAITSYSVAALIRSTDRL